MYDHLIVDSEPTTICPACQEPLTWPVVDGLHARCHKVVFQHDDSTTVINHDL